LQEKHVKNRKKTYKVKGKARILLFFVSVEREHVQKKTFTKWVNSHLCRINCRVVDLYTDLRDGKLLIKLLEILSGERLVRFGGKTVPTTLNIATSSKPTFNIRTFKIITFSITLDYDISIMIFSMTTLGIMT
jgi:hypothetical protein